MHIMFGVAGGIVLASWLLGGCPGLGSALKAGAGILAVLAGVSLLALVYFSGFFSDFPFGGAALVLVALVATGVALATISNWIQDAIYGSAVPAKAAVPLAAQPAQYAQPTRLLLPYYPAPIPEQYRFPAGPRRVPMARSSLRRVAV